MSTVRFAAPPPPAPPGRAARLLRAVILLGVWALVGLAGVAVYSHLT